MSCAHPIIQRDGILTLSPQIFPLSVSKFVTDKKKALEEKEERESLRTAWFISHKPKDLLGLKVIQDFIGYLIIRLCRCHKIATSCGIAFNQ